MESACSAPSSTRSSCFINRSTRTYLFDIFKKFLKDNDVKPINIKEIQRDYVHGKYSINNCTIKGSVGDIYVRYETQAFFRRVPPYKSMNYLSLNKICVDEDGKSCRELHVLSGAFIDYQKSIYFDEYQKEKEKMRSVRQFVNKYTKKSKLFYDDVVNIVEDNSETEFDSL